MEAKFSLAIILSPIPDARWLPREKGNSPEETWIFIWRFSYTSLGLIKQKETKIIALACTRECLTQHITLCQCQCVVPEEPLCQLLEWQEVKKWFVALYLWAGCAPLWCPWEAVRGWQLCYQPACTSEYSLHSTAVSPSCDQEHSLEQISASRISRWSTKLPCRQVNSSVFSVCSSLLSWLQDLFSMRSQNTVFSLCGDIFFHFMMCG